MRSINKVIIIGNLTRDPEMRTTPSGQNVTTFGVATNRQWVTREGDKKNSAEFHECVAWAKLAEICNQYLKKGALVYIEGYLKTRSWENDGVKKFKTEIVMQDMIMLEKKGESGDDDYVPEGEDEIEDSTSEETPAQKPAETPATPTEAPVAPAQAPAETSPSAPADTTTIDIDKDLGL